MKHTLSLLFACLLFTAAHSQFSGLMKKMKDKVADKIAGHSKKDTTTATPPKDTVSAMPERKAPDEPVAGDGPAGPGTKKPQAPVFPTTGKLVKASKASYGVDTDKDWAALLKQAPVQDYISRLRQKGLKGDDKAVLMQSGDNRFPDIEAAMKAKYGTNHAVLPMGPSITFAAFFSNYDYVMTNDFLRAEIGRKDSVTGMASLAGSMLDALAPGGVTIVDVKGRKSYTVANFMGILSAAIVEDISGYQDAIGLSTYFKKYMHQPGIKLEPKASVIFHGYQSTMVRMEIPVTPTVEENGRPGNGLLYLHSMLSQDFSAMSGGAHYDPSYKLYLETYYSHDVDGKIPAGITSDKNVLNVDGFYIGSVLKDEKGNEVDYVLRGIDPNVSIDEGMFMIPAGYEKMTQAQFHEALMKALGVH